MRNPVWPSSCVTLAGTSNELDVQNKWEEDTHYRRTVASSPAYPPITRSSFRTTVIGQLSAGKDNREVQENDTLTPLILERD